MNSVEGFFFQLRYWRIISVDIKHDINMKPVKDRAQSWQFHVPLELFLLRLHPNQPVHTNVCGRWYKPEGTEREHTRK